MITGSVRAGVLGITVWSAPSAAARSGDLIDVSGEFDRWFDHYRCSGLVLRPDAYVYGVFTTLEEAGELLAQLETHLRDGVAPHGGPRHRSARRLTRVGDGRLGRRPAGCTVQ